MWQGIQFISPSLRKEERRKRNLAYLIVMFSGINVYVNNTCLCSCAKNELGTI